MSLIQISITQKSLNNVKLMFRLWKVKLEKTSVALLKQNNI